MRFPQALALLAALSLAFAADVRTPTQEGIVYGVADGVQLTMDYYAPKGPGAHPIAIIIHGGGYQRGDSKSGSEAYCADFLAPAGYAVFSINYRLAPKYPYPYMVYDVERSVRYLRHNAAKWHADPARIALVGGSAGGFLSNMAGLRGGPGDPAGTRPRRPRKRQSPSRSHAVRAEQFRHRSAQCRRSRAARPADSPEGRSRRPSRSVSHHICQRGRSAVSADPRR